MLVYKDKTFCPYWQGCDKGSDCHRAITPMVEQGSYNIGLPLCVFTSVPECYTEVEDEDV